MNPMYFIICLFIVNIASTDYLCCTASSVNIRSSPCGTVMGQASQGDRYAVTGKTKNYCGYDWAELSNGNWVASQYFEKCFNTGTVCASTFVNIRTSPCGEKLSTASPKDEFTLTGSVSYDCGRMWNEFSGGKWGASGYFETCSSSDPDPTTVTRDFTVPDPENFCFPVYKGFYYNTKNWGQSRVKFDYRGRCHPGVDLLTYGEKNQGSIQTITEGEVIGVSRSWYKCKSGKTDNTNVGTYEYVGAVYVYNDIINKTFIYGEINHYDIDVNVGDYVSKGQHLGVASKCSMLHLEIYNGRGRNHGSGRYQGRSAYGWLLYDTFGYSALPRGNQVCQERDYVMNILDDIGSELLNPLPFIEQIKNNGQECRKTKTYPASHYSLYTTSDLDDDMFPPDEDDMDLYKENSFGIIFVSSLLGSSFVGIVVICCCCSLLCCGLCIGCTTICLRRKARNNSKLKKMNEKFIPIRNDEEEDEEEEERQENFNRSRELKKQQFFKRRRGKNRY